MNNLFFKEEHFMIQEMVRDFAKNKVEPIARDLDEQEKFPKDLVAEMGELGLMGIMVPERYGGSGFDMTSFATAIIELGRVDASVASSEEAIAAARAAAISASNCPPVADARLACAFAFAAD